MIWVFICFNARVRVNTLQPMILFGIPSQLLFWKMQHTYKKSFSTFSPATLGGKSIFLLP
jgi:hypothetical protein